jgi:hypothetical protein
MDTATLVLRIIAARGWRNGALQDLVAKALRGEPIERGDVDMTDKQWEAVCTRQAKQLARAIEVLKHYAVLHGHERIDDTKWAREALKEIDPPRTDRICHQTQAPCESPEACDAQQACARGKA